MLALLLLPLLWAGSLQQHQDYQLQVPQLVTVQEGLCVLVPCAFSYPWSSWYNTPPLHTFWFWARDDVRVDDPVATNNPNRAVKPGTKNRFSLVGNAWENNCSLHIRDARIRDTGSYFFRVERGWDVRYSYKDNQLNLQVTALTEKPVIHISEALESGRPTRVSCSLPGSCQGGRPLTFSWSGSVLKSVDPETLQSPVLTLTPRPQDHGTNLTCEVKLGRYAVTTERTTIRLNVSYAPRNLSISLFFGNGTACRILQNCSSSVRMLEGQSLQLRCDVDSSPPARLRWARGSPDLNASRSYSTGVLELPRVGPADEGSFACHADNAWGSQNASLSLSVFHPLEMLHPSCSWEARSLRCSCSSRAWPAPTLRWRLGDRLLGTNSSNASFTVTSTCAGLWANSSLSLRGELNASLRLLCEAQNTHERQRTAVLVLPGKSASRAGEVVAALGGAGAMALLCLCLGLVSFCIMKIWRTKAAGTPQGTCYEEPVMGAVAWASKQKPQPDNPQVPVLPNGDAPPHQEEQELHYASLSFCAVKSQRSQDLEATNNTEYSEIKMSK